MDLSPNEAISLLVYVFQYLLLGSCLLMILSNLLFQKRRGVAVRVDISRQGLLVMYAVMIFFNAVELYALVDWTLQYGLQYEDVVDDLLWLCPKVDFPILSILVLIFLRK